MTILEQIEKKKEELRELEEQLNQKWFKVGAIYRRTTGLAMNSSGFSTNYQI